MKWLLNNLIPYNIKQESLNDYIGHIMWLIKNHRTNMILIKEWQ